MAFQHAGRLLKTWRRTLIFAHQRPDGDSLGAMVTMARVMTGHGHTPLPFIYDELPERYRFLALACDFQRWSSQQPPTADISADGILILDTGSWSQLEPIAAFLRTCRLPRIIVDQHATSDDLSGPGAETIRVADQTAASTCTLIFEWCQALNWPIDATSGEALLTGIATDTGWFRFSNTDPRTLTAAANLLACTRVHPDVLYSRLYDTWSTARLRLKAQMLGTLELHANDSVAIIHLTREMFQRAGAEPADSEELVNEPMATANILVTALLIEQQDGRTRVNFRSKSPEVCGRDIDVAAIARSFGGGGHSRAAGARIEGPLSEVHNRVLDAIMNVIRQQA